MGRNERFTKILAELLDRFNSKQNIDLDQLESLASTGHVVTHVNLRNVEIPYTQLEKVRIGSFEVLPLQTNVSLIKGSDLCELLEQEYVPLQEFSETDIEEFNNQVEQKIPKAASRSIKVSIFYKHVKEGVYFMEYKRPFSYQKHQTAEFQTFSHSRKWKPVPYAFPIGRIILVAKKKQV